MDFTEEHGEFEPISTARDHSFNDVGTKPLVTEFLCQTDSPDVLRAKPHLVADIILWGFASVGIIELGHVVSCLDYSVGHTFPATLTHQTSNLFTPSNT